MRRCNVMYAVGLLATAWIVGCQYDPDSNTYITTKPAESDVVGTYQFARQYVDTSATVPGHPVILLSPDHSCTITDFPDWTAGTGIGTWKLAGNHSGTGTWTIDVVGGLGAGSGTTKHIYGVRFDNLPGLINARLTLANGSRGLCFGYGDPDSGNSMTFDKVK